MKPAWLPDRFLAAACFAWSLIQLVWGVFWGAWGLLDKQAFAGKIADPPANLDPGAAGAVVVIGVFSALLIYAIRALIVALGAIRIALALLLSRGAGRAWQGLPGARGRLATWAILTIVVEGASLLVSGGRDMFARFDVGLALLLAIALLAAAFRPVTPGIPTAEFLPRGKIKALGLLDDAV